MNLMKEIMKIALAQICLSENIEDNFNKTISFIHQAAEENAKGITVLGEDVEVPAGARVEDGAIISEF